MTYICCRKRDQDGRHLPFVAGPSEFIRKDIVQASPALEETIVEYHLEYRVQKRGVLHRLSMLKKCLNRMSRGRY